MLMEATASGTCIAVPSVGLKIVISGLPASAPGSTAVIGSIPSFSQEVNARNNKRIRRKANYLSGR